MTVFVVYYKADVVWSIEVADATARPTDSHTVEYSPVHILFLRMMALTLNADLRFLFSSTKKRIPKRNSTPAPASKHIITLV
jgi:hypothetical protein